MKVKHLAHSIMVLWIILPLILIENPHPAFLVLWFITTMVYVGVQIGLFVIYNWDKKIMKK